MYWVSSYQEHLSDWCLQEQVLTVLNGSQFTISLSMSHSHEMLTMSSRWMAMLVKNLAKTVHERVTSSNLGHRNSQYILKHMSWTLHDLKLSTEGFHSALSCKQCGCESETKSARCKQSQSRLPQAEEVGAAVPLTVWLAGLSAIPAG